MLQFLPLSSLDRDFLLTSPLAKGGAAPATRARAAETTLSRLHS
jgi:hypothetical protein